jgi:hypothetical protein
MELISTPALTEVKWSPANVRYILTFNGTFKYRDPLHLLLEHIAKVGIEDPNVP